MSSIEPNKLNLTGYIQPQVNLPPVEAPHLSTTAEIESTQAIAPPKAGALSGFFNWVKSFFGFKTEEESASNAAQLPYERQQAADFIERTLENEKNRTKNLDVLNENFLEQEEVKNLLTDAGLHRAIITAKLKSLGLQKSELLFNEEEMMKIRSFIKEVKTKLDDSLKKQIEKGENQAFYEKIYTGTATLLIATTLVYAGLTFLTGGTALIAALPPALKATSAATTGALGLYNEYLKYSLKTEQADHKALQHTREFEKKRSDEIFSRQNEANQRHANDWKAIREIQKNRDNTKKLFT